MKRIVISFLTIFLFTVTQAQDINSQKLRLDLAYLIADAANGFPETLNSFKEKTIYNTSYTVKRSLFGIKNKGGLFYKPPKEKTKYTEAEAERFYFGQSFKPEDSFYELIRDSLEIIFDATAKEAGLKKNKIKPPKEYKNKWDEYTYSSNNKPAFGFIKYKETNAIYVSIYSPFRPKDIAPPLKTLGCIVFSLGNFTYKYVSPVYGQSLEDIRDTKALAARAFSNSGIAEKDYQYTWYPNKTFYDIQQMFKKPIIVQEIGGITVK
ncbi:hypothetical protein [Sediminibacterium sp.]|uniref:hypothetical protein n=1 Tax=Sediminibacterium sp. TaxID=1917865 RepID=UPI0025FDB2ED|nr:hypothetical protein [Sediminibacterium sp.]MBT9483744.1 hypothetical protein [Sediminibacterium sp.]